MVSGLHLLVCDTISRAETVAHYIGYFLDGVVKEFFLIAWSIVEDLDEIELADAEARLPIDWE